MTLLDLEPDPLHVAKAGLERVHKDLNIQIQQHDILSHDPIPLSYQSQSTASEKYDSVSLTYLLHTLPVPPSKIKVFSKLKKAIKSSGVVFGATVLGPSPCHSLAARILLWILNTKGVSLLRVFLL